MSPERNIRKKQKWQKFIRDNLENKGEYWLNGWNDLLNCLLNAWMKRQLAPIWGMWCELRGVFLLLSLTRAGRSNPQALEPGVEKHCGYFVGWGWSIQRKDWQNFGAFVIFKPRTNSSTVRSGGWKLRPEQKCLWNVKCTLTQGQGLTASLGKKPILLVARILPYEDKRLLIAVAIYMTGSR